MTAGPVNAGPAVREAIARFRQTEAVTTPACPTVIDAAARVRAGEQSAEELLRASLDSVAEHNDALNAFVHLDPDLALREA